MKNTVILILLFASLWAIQITTAQDISGYSPTWQEFNKQHKMQRKYLTQQIGTLKTYGALLKKGYTICKEGLGTIGRIKDMDFNQHNVYFTSLTNVNSSVARSPKVKQILQWEKVLVKEMKSFASAAENESAFTPEEKKYFNNVSDNVLNASTDALDQLERLITSGKTSMEDDERISRIDSIHRKSSSRYSFVRAFKDQAMTIASQRKKEKQEVDYSLIIRQSL